MRGLKNNRPGIGNMIRFATGMVMLAATLHGAPNLTGELLHIAVDPLAATEKIKPVNSDMAIPLPRSLGAYETLLATVSRTEPTAQPKIAPAARLAHPLRLMSFNIRMGCGHDDPFNLAQGSLGYLPACAEAIRSIKPDVVGIQEIDCKSKRAGFVDQTAELAKLAGMEGAWVEKIPRYGIAVLFREKPLAVTKTLFPGKIHTRALQIVEFKDYIVANTHFPLSETTRTNAARIVIEKLKGAAKPVFLMGDLNARPASETLRILKEDFVLLSGDCWPTWPARAPKETIDYIFVDKAHAGQVNVRSHGVESFPDATDHCAVWVDLEPKDGASKTR